MKDTNPAAARAGAPAEGPVRGGFGVYHVLFTLGVTALGISFLAGGAHLFRVGGFRELHQDPLVQARRLADRGFLDRAAGQFRMAALIDPSAPATWYSLGQTLAKSGRYDDAEEAFHRALAVNPGLTAAWIALGDAALDRGRPQEAAERYSKALAFEPRSAAAHNGLGIVLASLGRLDEAIHHFTVAANGGGGPKVRENLERARSERAGAPPVKRP
jgi:tetratricopeptide (TPR) repeat protein